MTDQDPRNVKDILDALARRSQSFQSLSKRLRNYGWDMFGILLLASSLMTLLLSLIHI